MVFFCVLKCYYCQNDDNSNITLIFKWHSLDFVWLNKEQKLQFIAEQKFIPENCVIREFKIHKDSAYVTLPRWKTGVPATLAKISINSNALLPASPLLEPYPTWSMQILDDCFALQSVHAIEIDDEGKLWILDNGMVEELTQSRTRCPPKLMIVDLQTKYIVKSNIIPSHIIRNGSIFTSVALDNTKKILYVADSNHYNSGFIIYTLTSGVFKRVACDELNSDEDKSGFHYIPDNIRTEFVSLTLNSDANKLYFSNFETSDLYYVNVSLFSSDILDISSYTVNLGKNGRNVKLVSDSKGYMYFDILNRKSVAQWRESSWVFQYTPRIILQNKLLCQWISSLDIDEEGYLWVISSRFMDYMYNKTNLEKENIRIFRAYVPRKEKPKKPKTGFSVEYVVLVLFIIIIGLIVIEILMFNID